MSSIPTLKEIELQGYSGSDAMRKRVMAFYNEDRMKFLQTEHADVYQRVVDSINKQRLETLVKCYCYENQPKTAKDLLDQISSEDPIRFKGNISLFMVWCLVENMMDICEIITPSQSKPLIQVREQRVGQLSLPFQAQLTKAIEKRQATNLIVAELGIDPLSVSAMQSFSSFGGTTGESFAEALVEIMVRKGILIQKLNEALIKFGMEDIAKKTSENILKNH